MSASDTASPPAADAVRLASVRRIYGTPENPVTALDGVTFGVAPATFTAIMGPSGSGKSTLLQCAAGLDQPTHGEVFVDGAEMTGGTETELTKFRRERIGFVFQELNLLPTLTALENVTLPLRLAGRRLNRRRAVEVLERVGLGDRLEHLPTELSGGQQQHVAIARALVTDPVAILADEPTGALDTKGARAVLALLQEAVRLYDQTVVMVTHDPVAAAHADSVLFLADGRIVGRLADPTSEAVAERMTELGDAVTKRRVVLGGE